MVKPLSLRPGRDTHKHSDKDCHRWRCFQRMLCLCQVLVWITVFHLALTEFLLGANSGWRPDRFGPFREPSSFSAVIARRYVKLFGVLWVFNKNAEASPSTLWRRLGSEWRRLGARLGESLLPSVRKIWSW